MRSSWCWGTRVRFLLGGIIFFSSLNKLCLENHTENVERKYLNGNGVSLKLNFPSFLCSAICGIQREAKRNKII